MVAPHSECGSAVCTQQHVLSSCIIHPDAQLTCQLGSGEACQETFCPGDEVEYTCDVGTPLGSTVWAFPAGTCEDENNEINLFQSGLANCADEMNSRYVL